MTKEELIAEIAKQDQIARIDAPDTFLRQESFKNQHMFFRVADDDVVLMVSMMNATTAEARSAGPQILDFAQATLTQIAGRLITKLRGLDSGFSQFDHLIALGPEVKTSPPLKD